MKTGQNAMSVESRRETQVKIDRNEIAPRAYKLWCAAGRPEGCDLEFWLQAESELSAAQRAGSQPAARARADQKH
jgi:hypothetical protein